MAKGTSDRLKEVFARHGGGAEKDWKRVSKNKNEAGEWLRTFENRQTGAMVEVRETADGQFLARRLAEGSATAAAPNPPASKTAGKYVFALCDIGAEDFDDINPFYAIITPRSYWEKTGYVYDQPSMALNKILPDADDVNECGTWVFEVKFDTAADLAKSLLQRGFHWEAKFQDFIDKKFTAEMTGLHAQHTASVAKPPAPKPPAPKPPAPKPPAPKPPAPKPPAPKP